MSEEYSVHVLRILRTKAGRNGPVLGGYKADRIGLAARKRFVKILDLVWQGTRQRRGGVLCLTF